jgi:hypothetical protein
MKIRFSFKYLFYLFTLLAFYAACGIEDSVMYFQEPKNLTYSTSDYSLSFDGYNQEEDADTYMFIGYDVYYYFDDPKNAKLVQVRNPLSTLSAYRNRTFIDFSGESRFGQLSASDKSSIYEWVSCPVKESMSGILSKGSSGNVVLYLDNYPDHAYPAKNQTGTNPSDGTTKIYYYEMYPYYYQYGGQSWYTDSAFDSTKFYGFFDQKFIDNCVPAASKIDSTSYYIYFYVKAKGFNSKAEMTRGSKITESVKSNTIKVTITKKTAT